MVKATSDRFNTQEMFDVFTLLYDLLYIFPQCLSDGPVEPVPPGKLNVNMYPWIHLKSEKIYNIFLLIFHCKICSHLILSIRKKAAV